MCYNFSMTNALNGLTDKQVKSRVEQGKINRTNSKTQNTISKIILKNTLTIFNFVNLVLAVMIFLVGSYKNMLFILIAIANTMISIINEVRAKRTVDKMRLVAEQKPTVIRNGRPIQIDQEQIVEGDLLIYSLGDQIIVDGKIEEGVVEVNEAYVTGEQNNITKKQGDKLISGSFVVSGTCKATATAVGADSELSKIEQTAHTIKTADSKLFSLMNNIVKYISYALIPIGILLLIARFRVPGTTTELAVTSTVASLINMIPEGLILLTSSVLALATIRLSKKQVLVQDLYSVETLARVDCVALDKTGTLTTGNMTVVDYKPLQKSFEKALASILSHQATDNATTSALKQKFLTGPKIREIEDVIETIDFSSERKYSGIKTKDATYLMGAPEFLGVKVPTKGNYRTLAVVKDKTLLGYVYLEDELRHNAKKIVNYFYKNNIEVKIISGDSLNTVQSIAESTGVKNVDKAVDLSTIKNPDYRKLVKDNTIFTRVKPAEKKQLIKALREEGNTVAMTGDGVNDILAMKEADVSIAIGDGSDAARRSAKLVLLNSGFESVPSIIDEGRQSINNLERSTALFLAKTVYASILAVLFIFIPLKAPFESPIEMTLLNFACIGFPGLILALEHNTERIKNRFLKNILEYSVPVGLTISIAMLALSIMAHTGVFPRHELATTAIFVTFVIDLILIYRISRPLNALRSTLIIVIIGIMAGAFLIPFFHHLFDFVFLTNGGLIVTLVTIAIATLIFELIRFFMHKISTRTLS